jgi:hypothetical protein
MLKRLTGKKARSHHGLYARKAYVPPCYWECLIACEVEMGGRYNLENVREVVM